MSAMTDLVRIGHRRLHFATLDSTNTHAASFSNDPANHGLVVTADQQSAGRGQYERVWQAPAGSSVLMSVLVFPPAEARRPVLLTAWAALAVCRTIQKLTGLEPRLKWPNDVLIGARKVCGILCEAGYRHVVAGIGLNVNQSANDFARMELPLATSLAVERDRWFDVTLARETLIESLDRGYAELVQEQRSDFEARWAGLFQLVGHDARIEKMDGTTMSGRLIELAFTGVVVEKDGATSRVAPEMIRQVSSLTQFIITLPRRSG
jgi:BirA family biotin operon repressor/biotin-[acetyl-CoA-carboxylase] ligase